MIAGITLFLGLFAWDNQEFFKTVEQNQKDGYTWEYVGKQSPGDNPAITILDGQNNEVIYWKMTK